MRVGIALAAVIAMTGCVSQDKYRVKEQEADKYRADWQKEVEARKAIRGQFDAVQREFESMQTDVKALQSKARTDEDNLTAKQAELRKAQDLLAAQAALIDELAKSKKKLEAAKAELEKRSSEYEQLAQSLKGEIESGRIELSELKGKMTVKMKDKILFSSGSATIGKEGYSALTRVAEALRSVKGKAIRVEGHTDNVPTAGSSFASNWELSAARSLAVVRFLQDQGVDPTKLASAGYGEYQPIGANDTPEGRSLNRRIEIVLVNAEGMTPPTLTPAEAAAPDVAPGKPAPKRGARPAKK
ncbi:MAG: OmpA family protein [Anaeromyxobacteraceae bacterium]